MWSPAMQRLLRGPKETVTVNSLSWLFLQPRPHILGIRQVEALQTLCQLEQLGAHVFSSEGTGEMSALTL